MVPLQGVRVLVSGTNAFKIRTEKKNTCTQQGDCALVYIEPSHRGTACTRMRVVEGALVDIPRVESLRIYTHIRGSERSGLREGTSGIERRGVGGWIVVFVSCIDGRCPVREMGSGCGYQCILGV